MKKPKKKTMSLSQERMSQLQAIATDINTLTVSECNSFNGFYNPDIIAYGCATTPSASINVSALATACEGLTHEEIEFLSNELNNKSPQNRSIGIKPGANPGGSPTGNK